MCAHAQQHFHQIYHTHTDTHFNPYNLSVIVLPAAVSGGQCGRALLQVPRLASTLSCARDGDGVYGVGVAVAGAVVSAAPAVA